MTLTKKGIRDSILVNKAINGDQVAYNILYNNNYKMVKYLVNSFIKYDKDTINEHISLIFQRAFLNINKYTDNYAFSTWLHRLAYNYMVDISRRNKTSTTCIYDNIYKEDEVLNAEESIILNDKNNYIKLCIDELSFYYKQLIIMRYYNEMKYKDIAKELDKPLGTIKVGIMRANNELKLLLNRDKL